jgi:hypothetical protein
MNLAPFFDILPGGQDRAARFARAGATGDLSPLAALWPGAVRRHRAYGRRAGPRHPARAFERANISGRASCAGRPTEAHT